MLKTIKQQFKRGSMTIKRLMATNYLKNYQNKVSLQSIINTIQCVNQNDIDINSMRIFQEIKNPIIVEGLFKKCSQTGQHLHLTRQIHPFLSGSLKGSSTTAGLKKVIYNRVFVQNRQLRPGYNRRKHNHSHSMIIENQLGRVSKTFGYMGRNKLLSIIAFALNMAHCSKAEQQSYSKNNIVRDSVNSSHLPYAEGDTQSCRPIENYPALNNTLPLLLPLEEARQKKPGKDKVKLRSIPNLVSIIEAQEALLFWRNQFRYSVGSSRQAILHRNCNEKISIFRKNNTAIMLNIYKCNT
jgi:hypothetical protein